MMSCRSGTDDKPDAPIGWPEPRGEISPASLFSSRPSAPVPLALFLLAQGANPNADAAASRRYIGRPGRGKAGRESVFGFSDPMSGFPIARRSCSREGIAGAEPTRSSAIRKPPSLRWLNDRRATPSCSRALRPTLNHEAVLDAVRIRSCRPAAARRADGGGR